MRRGELRAGDVAGALEGGPRALGGRERRGRIVVQRRDGGAVQVDHRDARAVRPAARKPSSARCVGGGARGGVGHRCEGAVEAASTCSLVLVPRFSASANPNVSGVPAATAAPGALREVAARDARDVARGRVGGGRRVEVLLRQCAARPRSRRPRRRRGARAACGPRRGSSVSQGDRRGSSGEARRRAAAEYWSVVRRRGEQRQHLELGLERVAA